MNNAAMTFFIANSDRAADGQRLGPRPPPRFDLNQLSRVLCRYEAVIVSFASNGGGGEQDMPAARYVMASHSGVSADIFAKIAGCQTIVPKMAPIPSVSAIAIAPEGHPHRCLAGIRAAGVCSDRTEQGMTDKGSGGKELSTPGEEPRAGAGSLRQRMSPPM
jgi:hypothetical protein